MVDDAGPLSPTSSLSYGSQDAPSPAGGRSGSPCRVIPWVGSTRSCGPASPCSASCSGGTSYTTIPTTVGRRGLRRLQQAADGGGDRPDADERSARASRVGSSRGGGSRARCVQRLLGRSGPTGAPEHLARPLTCADFDAQVERRRHGGRPSSRRRDRRRRQALCARRPRPGTTHLPRDRLHGRARRLDVARRRELRRSVHLLLHRRRARVGARGGARRCRVRLPARMRRFPHARGIRL